MISSSTGTAANVGNGHCSINHGGGSGGLGPVMEIREMSGYCVPTPDKYYHAHHHHHGTAPIVSGATTARHSAVYHPQVFYTPPPPAPSTYPPSNAPPAPTDWTSPGAPDAFSHFMYTHHQYPPPAPQHHHHTDYGNFLGLPTTSCYEPDIVMMSAGAATQPLPPPSSPITLTTSNANNIDVQLGVGSVSSSIMTMTNSFLYPKPPSSSTVYHHSLDHTSVAALSLPEKNLPKVTSASISTPSSSSSSEDSDLEEDDEDNDDDDDKQVICIEDDEMISSLETSQESSWCMLCKKPSAATQASTTSTHPHCSSPQLAKILENIDDDELDISVCSDDIEIGGIEDEMIQAEQIQNSFKITISKLAQLINIAPSSLFSDINQGEEEQEAILCSKCQKLVGMAESLEKQLSSVLSTLRVSMEMVGQDISQNIVKHQTSTIAVQTDPIPLKGNEWKSRIFVVPCNSSSSLPRLVTLSIPSLVGSSQEEVSKERDFLCHECGRSFNCGRNLGKHLKRHHNEKSGVPNKIPCTREDCSTTCSDNTALQNHMKVHNGDKNYFCANCLKLFSTKSNLLAHTKSEICRIKDQKTNSGLPEESEGKGKNCFRCENCGLTFRTEKRFLHHANSKNSCSKSKTFGCETCNKVFGKASELRAHQTVHTGTKCFTCDVCGLGFSTKGNQRVHQRTHFNEKRFKCKFYGCGKRFTRNQTLQTHYSNYHQSE